MGWESLAPITDADLTNALTHEILTQLARGSWVGQVMALTELLDRPDIQDLVDDDWRVFAKFGEHIHDRIQRVFGVTLAEIAGLQSLIDEHPTQIEYELIKLSLRLRDLGTERLTWRDLLVIVKHTPPGSPLAGALSPVLSWTTTDHLVAFVFDAIRNLTWTTAGNRDNPVPKPFPRPGDAPVVSPVEHHRDRAAHYAELARQQREQKQLET